MAYPDETGERVKNLDFAVTNSDALSFILFSRISTAGMDVQWPFPNTTD